MNTKLLTSVGCLLLLAATMSPGVLGHDERAALDPNYAALGSNDDGVSGRYVGAAGPAIAFEAYTFPDGTLATGGILCDGEVVVDSAGFPANEEDVDNPGDPANTNSADGGLAPNTVDDGGAGGACHVATYQTASYNTNGCLSGQSAGGYDVSGVDIWLAATCDYQTVEGGESSLEVLALCVVNEVVLQTDPTALVPCVLAFVDCTLDPTCQDGQVSCGADSFADGIHFGYGSGAFGVKAEFPANPCPPGVATSAIFVWETVGTNGNVPVVYPATVGDVWTDLTGGGGGSGEPGVPVCAEEYDNGVYTTWPCPPQLCGLPLGYVAITSDNGAAVGTLSCHDSSHNTVGSLSTTSFTAGPILSGNHAHCNVSAVNGATYAFVQCGKV